MASKTDFSKKHRREANEGVYVCTVMVSADGSELQEECGCSFKMKKPSDCYSHALHLEKIHNITYDVWNAAEVAKIRAANPTIHAFVKSQTAAAYRMVLEWAIDHGVCREALLDDRFRQIMLGTQALLPQSREVLGNAVIEVSRLEKQELTSLIDRQSVSLCLDGGTTHDLHTLLIRRLL
eukprot:PhF_6_TR3469/c0_g3_i3/m.5080